MALTQLYAEFYRDTAVWNAEAADFSARYDLTMAIHKEFYAPRFSRIDASDGLDPEVRAPNQTAKAKLAELQAELARRRALRERFVNGEQALGRSERMRNEIAIASRRRLDYFFGGFTKDEVEHTTGALSPTPPMATCCEDPAFPLPLDWAAAPSAPLGPQMAANNAAAAVEAARNATAPTLTGDTETRLQAAEQQAVKAEAAHKSFEEWRKYNNVVEQSAVSDARTWASTVADNVAVLKETYGLTHKDIPALEIEVQHAKDVLNGDAWEFYTNGAAAAAWSFFSEHVVVPEIKRIALEMHSTENYALTDAEIESAWHQETHGLFGAYDVYQKGKDAAALIEQAKNLEGTAEASALAVADVMGRADIGDYKEVGDKLFGNLDCCRPR